MKKKVGRNDPCPCGSGKKFKKCCENKMIGKKFMAHKIDTAAVSKQASGLTSLFQNALPEKKEEETKAPKKIQISQENVEGKKFI